jgi:copper(I)-binding protein
MSRPLVSRPLVLAIAAVAWIAMACSAPAALTPSPGGFISAYAAYALPADAGADGAAYLTITNGQLKDDVLVGASSSVAASASIQQTTTDPSGLTAMHPAGPLKIKAGQDLVLAPGGYHVMLTGLKQALVAGSTFPITLTFEQTGPVTVSVEVRAS